MNRTARSLGLPLLGLAMALMQPHPARTLAQYLRAGLLRRIGQLAWDDLCTHSNHLAQVRAHASAEFARGMAPPPSRLIVPPSPVWRGRR